jgi:gluconokinase
LSRRGAEGLVLALDIGSSSTRSALFSEAGVRPVETSAARQYAIKYTEDSGAELDPAVLLGAARACVRETLRARSAPIVAVAGSAFWHALLGLDRKGHPLTPIFTWADNRSASDAADLRGTFPEREIQLQTGCMLRAPFWPAKLLWLRRTNPKLFARVTRWSSPADWIFRELFGAETTSHSMASGTGMYDLRTRSWHTELFAHCGVRVDQLGTLSTDPHDAPNALRGAKVFPAIGDGAASNLGSGADTPGRVAINIGTSAAVRTIAARAQDLPAGLFAYAVDDERVVIGGAISNAGNLREWCLRELRLGSDGDKALERRASAADNLIVLPHLVQERAPTWPDRVSGTFAGLTHVTSAADIYRGATTATYYRLADILEALPPAEEVIVSGGVLKSKASLAILADCLGRDIHVCRELESSLRGAAIFALAKLGYTVPPLRTGKLVRHNPALADKHRVRREKQRALERLLAG